MTQSDELLIMRLVHIDHLLAINVGSEMQAMSFDIDGMICGGCRVLVERRLGQLTGVSQATVALKPGLASVVLDPTLVTEAQLISTIKEAGFLAAARSVPRPA